MLQYRRPAALMVHVWPCYASMVRHLGDTQVDGVASVQNMLVAMAERQGQHGPRGVTRVSHT